MKPGRPDDGHPAALLGAAVLAALALRLIFSSSLTGFDEFAYARIAADVSEGTFNLRDASGYYGFRYMLVLPAALAGAVLGQTPAAAAAWPLLCSLGNTLLAYLLGREFFGRRVGVTAAFFQAFLPASVIYGTMLYPEEVLVFWTGLSALLFLKGSAASGRWGGGALLALAGLCAGCGWHTRLNSAVMLIVFAAWAVRSGLRPAHLLFAAGFLGALVPDWAAGWAAAGDPFFSLRAQLAKLAADTAVYPMGHFIYLRGLLGLDLYGLALFGLYFYFSAAGVAAAALRKELSRLYAPLAWVALVFLYLEFGPATLSPYQPVHKQLRFLTMAFFPLLIVAARFVSGLKPAPKRAAWALLLLTSVAAVRELRDYHAAEAAPWRQAAAFVSAQAPSVVYADGGLAAALGYYTRGLHREPYYRPAGAAQGYIRPFSEAAVAADLSGACAAAERGLPARLAALEKKSLELGAAGGVYCFK